MEKLFKINLGRKSRNSTAYAKIVGPYEDDKRLIVVKVVKILEFNIDPMFKSMYTDFELIIEKRQIIG